MLPQVVRGAHTSVNQVQVHGIRWHGALGAVGGRAHVTTDASDKVEGWSEGRQPAAAAKSRGRREGRHPSSDRRRREEEMGVQPAGRVVEGSAGEKVAENENDGEASRGWGQSDDKSEKSSRNVRYGEGHHRARGRGGGGGGGARSGQDRTPPWRRRWAARTRDGEGHCPAPSTSLQSGERAPVETECVTLAASSDEKDIYSYNVGGPPSFEKQVGSSTIMASVVRFAPAQ